MDPSHSSNSPSLLRDITHQMIQIWNQLMATCRISKPSGAMTPFFGTPAFPPALRAMGHGPRTKEDHWRLAQILRVDQSLTTATSSTSVASYPTQWFQRQVMSYIRTIPSLADAPPGRPSNSCSLPTLFISTEGSDPWPTSLHAGVGIRTTSLHFSCGLAKVFYSNSNCPLAIWPKKRGLNWWLDGTDFPPTIHHFSPSSPDSCWCCHVARCTMLHIWWEFPL